MTTEFLQINLSRIETAYEQGDLEGIAKIAALLKEQAEAEVKELPLRYWSTKVHAKSPLRNQTAQALDLYAGPKVPGRTREEAEKWCDENGLGFLHVDGEYIEEQAVTKDDIEWQKAWLFTPDN